MKGLLGNLSRKALGFREEFMWPGGTRRRRSTSSYN